MHKRGPIHGTNRPLYPHVVPFVPGTGPGLCLGRLSRKGRQKNACMFCIHCFSSAPTLRKSESAKFRMLEKGLAVLTVLVVLAVLESTLPLLFVVLVSTRQRGNCDGLPVFGVRPVSLMTATLAIIRPPYEIQNSSEPQYTPRNTPQIPFQIRNTEKIRKIYANHPISYIFRIFSVFRFWKGISGCILGLRGVLYFVWGTYDRKATPLNSSPFSDILRTTMAFFRMWDCQHAQRNLIGCTPRVRAARLRNEIAPETF